MSNKGITKAKVMYYREKYTERREIWLMERKSGKEIFIEVTKAILYEDKIYYFRFNHNKKGEENAYRKN